MIELKHNPWISGNIDTFLFYCCPECDVKEKDPETFKKHAVQSHENAKVIYAKENIATHNQPPEIHEEINIKDENLDPLSDIFTENHKQLPPLEKKESEEKQPEPIRSFHSRNNPSKRKQIQSVTEGTEPAKKPKCPKIQCYICGELTESELEVKEHIATHNTFISPKMYGERRIYHCVECCRVFKSSESLQLHVCGILPQSWLGPDKKSQKCPKCEEEFEKYGDFLCHHNIDHKEETEELKDLHFCRHTTCMTGVNKRPYKSLFEVSLHASIDHRHFCTVYWM